MKTYISFILVLFVFTSCAVQPPVIKTEGNNFSSSKSPSLQIQLPQDFMYLGTIDKDFWFPATEDGRGTSSVDRNIYLYGSLTKDNYMKKLITIAVLKLPADKYWNPSTIGVQKTIKQSTIKCGERRFQYCIKAKKTTGKLTSQYLLDKGITTPECNMWMLFGKVFGENVKVYISYYEDISNFEEYDIKTCEDWFETDNLNDKQNEYIVEFEKRAHNSINVQ